MICPNLPKSKSVFHKILCKLGHHTVDDDYGVTHTVFRGKRKYRLHYYICKHCRKALSRCKFDN